MINSEIIIKTWLVLSLWTEETVKRTRKDRVRGQLASGDLPARVLGWVPPNIRRSTRGMNEKCTQNFGRET
jgi:hypothetical protein